MLKKGSKLNSILRFKCPSCQEGDFFVSHPYNLPKAGKIHEKCPVCGEKNSKEIGFYYGAMYVSYALAVAVFVTVWVAVNVLHPNHSFEFVIIAIVGAEILLTPLTYALSKIIWANMFIPYKGKKENKAS